MESAPVLITVRAIRTPRAAAVAGLACSVLFATAVALIDWAIPPGSRDAGAWLSDDAKRRAVSVALQLLPFAGFAFLWFIGVLRDRIGEGEDRFFASVFLGSGLLFVAMFFVSGALSAGLGGANVRWLELVFPGWVFVLSIPILVVTFRRPDDVFRTEAPA